MKNRLFLITAIVFLIGCDQSKNSKNELNYIDFKVSKDTMIDSLKTATMLLDKMDYGNGATCFIVEGKLHYTRKDFGFSIVEMPEENSSSFPIIEPLNQDYSIQFFKLIQFLYRNGIHSMGKRSDGLFCFGYNQRKLNPNNDFNRSRDIVYIKEPKDKFSKFFYKSIIIDQYKNILLVAPETYDEPKLPTDEKSVKKRAEDFMKKKDNERNK
ncbi:MAG: hypothetical protein Q8N05_08230 [Bacteroidota bacterium]|nr:hypothetical protein [Bacteroidota bacterium]